MRLRRRRRRRHRLRGPPARRSSSRPTSATLVATVSDEVDLDHVRPDLAADPRAPRHHPRRRPSRRRRPAPQDRASAPPARTSTTSATPARSSSTAASCSRPAPACRWTRSSASSRPTAWSAASAASTATHVRRPTTRATVVCAYDYTVLAGTQGADQPPEDRPHARARRGVAAARWSSSPRAAADAPAPAATAPARRAGDPCVGQLPSPPARHSDVRVDGPAERRRADDRHQLRALLRRQRRPARRCDVVIATEDSNIGMGGPAMIEGGGLGVFAPDEVGPIDVQVAQRRRRHPRRATRRRPSPPPSTTSRSSRDRCPTWEHADQRLLRTIVPDNRLRTYDIRNVIDGARRHRLGARAAARLRPRHGHRARPHRGPGRRCHRQQPEPPRRRHRQRRARTRRLASCSCATPSTSRSSCSATRRGSWSARRSRRPASCATATGCSSPAPTCRSRMFMVVLRKAYGLGALAMAGGSVKEPFFCVAWPTGEFAGMGLEGQIKLGYRNELHEHRRPGRAQGPLRPPRRRGLRAQQGDPPGRRVRRRRRHRPDGHPRTGWRTACARSPAACAPTCRGASTSGDQRLRSTTVPPLARDEVGAVRSRTRRATCRRRPTPRRTRAGRGR